ncbi:hypothetical protein LCGC14_2809020 [marine sediment metagenome]|uniref:Uncharacterized protein n=1 Tax=marine sediment metagenome TaxID=412755 RepID=A0A0F8Z7C0_9ZZZZ
MGKIIIINRKNGERRLVWPGEVLAVDRLDDWYEPHEKKVVWWNPLDWIPKYFRLKDK